MSVTEELERFIVTELTQGRGIDSVAADEDLLASGVVDSHGVMELVGFIESRYGVIVEDDDLTPENFQSLQSIGAYVDGKKG